MSAMHVAMCLWYRFSKLSIERQNMTVVSIDRRSPDKRVYKEALRWDRRVVNYKWYMLYGFGKPDNAAVSVLH